jgi:hypothetical protein
MLAFISRLVLKLAAVRWLFKLSGLALLLPFAFLLKVVGIPLLLVLMVVGMPILILLFLFGLPIFAVLAVGGLLMGLIGTVLTIGVAAIKIGIFVVLPIWLMWKLASTVFGWAKRRGRGNGGEGGDASPPASDTEPVDPIEPRDAPPASNPHPSPATE